MSTKCDYTEEQCIFYGQKIKWRKKNNRVKDTKMKPRWQALVSCDKIFAQPLQSTVWEPLSLGLHKTCVIKRGSMKHIRTKTTKISRIFQETVYCNENGSWENSWIKKKRQTEDNGIKGLITSRHGEESAWFGSL